MNMMRETHDFLVRFGPATNLEVSKELGITTKQASQALLHLAEHQRVAPIGTRSRPGMVGRPLVVYEAKETPKDGGQISLKCYDLVVKARPPKTRPKPTVTHVLWKL
jgi:predicted ArsR family transcriptional regulator